jgi:hypothetical protein
MSKTGAGAAAADAAGGGNDSAELGGNAGAGTW